VLGGVPIVIQRGHVMATERATVGVTPPFPVARTPPG
jgi:hypothetical protein